MSTATNHSNHKLSLFFKELELLCHKDSLYFEELIQKISLRGHSVLIFFLSLPFITPAPTFGLSFIFGMAIAYVSVQMAMNNPPWIPQKIMKSEVPREGFKKIFAFIIKVLSKIEVLVKPRLAQIFHSKALRAACCLEMVILGILLALPLPPGTNAPPAIGIAIVALAYSEEDSLLLFIGQILFALNVLLFGSMAYLGVEGTKFILEKLW